MQHVSPPSTVSRRRALAGAAGPPSALLLAACATPGAAPQEASTAQPVRVVVTFPGGAVEDADFAPVMEAIARKHPTVVPEWAPATTIAGTQSYPDKLFTLIASDSAPDVFKTQGGTFGQFAESGAYRPLDDYLKRHAAAVQLDDFFPQHVEGGKYKGQQLHLANDGAPTGMWVNVDLFQREGLSLPTWDWTWADLLKAAQALTKRDAGGPSTQLGLGRPGWDFWIGAPAAISGPRHGWRMVIDQPPAVEALTWMQEAVHRYGVAPNAARAGRRPALGVPERADRHGLRRARRARHVPQRHRLHLRRGPLPRGPKGRVGRLGLGMTSISKACRSPTRPSPCSTSSAARRGSTSRSPAAFAHPSRKSLVEQAWYKGFKTERSYSDRINTVFPDTLKRGRVARSPRTPARPTSRRPSTVRCRRCGATPGRRWRWAS